MSENIEIEIKYRIANAEAAQKLLSIPRIGPFAVSEFGQKSITDTYLDTADESIAAAGYAYRFRQSGVQGAVEFKTLVSGEEGTYRRHEITGQADDPINPAQWPAGPARELALTLFGNGQPQPLFVIEQTRHKANLLQDKQPVSEISIDQVLWRAGDREWLAWELEVELYAGMDEDILAQVQKTLATLPYLTPEPLSKYERGLALMKTSISGDERPKPRSGIEFRTNKPTLDMVQRIVKYQVDIFIDNYDGVVAGKDPEAVHDARVATRRMRSSLYFFQPWLTPKETRRLRKHLRAAGEALGAVRDLDVSIRYVHEHAETVAPAAEGPLRSYLDGQRHAARQAMFAYFEGSDYRKFQSAIQDFLGAKPTNTEPVRVVLPGLLLRAAAEVSLFRGTLRHGCPVEHLHSLRIAIKRYRYLLEFTRYVTSPACERLIQPLVSMQDHLGDLHDADVGCKLAFSLMRQPNMPYTVQERTAMLDYATALFELREQLTEIFTHPNPPAPLWRQWIQPQTDAYLDEVIALITGSVA
ncbi:MAG: CHAD domain-containing protein [Caldilineales bacterium]|nr:CHAD domain-containing protein [Caldilineales bacterium]